MSSKNDFTNILKIKVYFDGKKVLEKTFQSGPVIIGRLPTCDIHFDLPFLSRQHCQIIQDGANFYLVDLNSRNGVFVEGETVSRYLVTDNFEFSIDKLKIKTQVDKKPVVLQPTLAQKESPKKASIPDSPTHHAITQSGISKKQVPRPTPKQAHQQIPKSSDRNSTVIQGIEEIDSERTALVKGDYRSELVEFHPGVLSTPKRKFEAVVTWKNQVYDVKEFNPKERVTIGNSSLSNLQIPSLPKGWALAHIDFDKAYCYVPSDKRFVLSRSGQDYNVNQLINSQFAKQQGSGIVFKMGFQDVVNIDLANDLKLTLRYVPSPGELTKKKLTEPDHALREAFLASLMINGIIALLMIIFAPESKNIPKLKDVPERYARLLVEPPKPIIPIPEPPPPPPPPPERKPPPKKEVAKKQPKKVPKKLVKVQPKPKVFKQPKKLVQQNQFPVRVQKPTRQKPVATNSRVNTEATTQVVEKPQPKLESLGALAALGAATNSPTPGPNVQNIQINKDAGGASSPTPNATGVLNAIPSSSGKLMAAGNGRVATGGKGIGSGTAYGTQGLGGGSGKRGVAGAVVGAPKLVTSSRTEGLTRAQVMGVVQKHLGEIQSCYERSLLSNPSLAGRMEFEWDIQASGSVSSVRIKRSTVNGGDSLGECVKKVFFSMRFPKASNGESTTPNIGFPFGRL